MGVFQKLSGSRLFRKIAQRFRFTVGYLYRLLVLPFGLFKIYKASPKTDEPPGPVPARSTITIDASDVKGEINQFLYGGFIEFLGECISGIWDDTNKEVPLVHGGLRQDVLEELKTLKVSVLRWPGGCFADMYFWKEGIGPRAERKSTPNRFWRWFGPKVGPRNDNHFGMDEFMLLIGELNTEPYININFGSGTPKEAAQWVEYANGDVNTEYGALRAQHGHPEPYNVKIWGIANEIWGFHEEGSCSAEEYGHRYLEFAAAMRTVDPSIMLVACGTDFTFPDWNQTLLEIAGDSIDWLSLHIYTPMLFFGRLSNSVKDFYKVIAGAMEIERRIQWMEESIVKVMGETKKIPITLDEWGTWWNHRQLFEGYFTLRDGIFAASVFEVLHRNLNAVEMGNYAQLVNVLPLIHTNPNDVYHNPIYLAFQLFSNYSESFVVSSTVCSDARPTKKWGFISATEVPYLGCSVTINKAKDKLVLIGINRHHVHDLPTSISIANFDPEPNAQVLELNGSHHSASNDFNKKGEVKIEGKEFQSASKEFEYIFPSHSVTALILRKKM